MTRNLLPFVLKTRAWPRVEALVEESPAAWAGGNGPWYCLYELADREWTDATPVPGPNNQICASREAMTEGPQGSA